MSVHINYTYARIMSLDIVGAHPRTVVGINPHVGPLDPFAVGTVAGARRKADAMEDTGLFNHQSEDDSEYTRLVKRLKVADDGLHTIRQCLANLSRNAVGKKRVRPEGEAVRLRKKFIKSLRNASPRSDNPGGAQFAFTFTLASLAALSKAVPMAMEDIEVPMPDDDLGHVGHYKRVITSQQDQVPMHIDSQSEVDCAGSTALVSISTVDTEMEETQEGAHTSHVLASSACDDEHADGVPQLVVPFNMDTSIPRFLGQAVVTKVRRWEVSPQGAVRGLGKASYRKATAAVVPYRKASRPQWYMTTPRLGVSLTIPEHLFGSLVSTSGKEVHAHFEGPLVPVTSAFTGRCTSSPTSFLRLVEPLISLDDDDDTTTSTVEDVVPDVLWEAKEGSPTRVEEVGCRVESTTPKGEFRGAFRFTTPVESGEEYPEDEDEYSEDDDEYSGSGSDIDGSLVSNEEPQADVEFVENVAEASEQCYPGSPVPVPVEETGEDVFGAVLRLPPPAFQWIVQATAFQGHDTSYDEDSHAEAFKLPEVEFVYEDEEGSLFSLASTPSPSSSSVCSMGSANSSAYVADIDEFSLYPVSEGETEESLITFDHDDEVAVIVHPEVFDSGFGSVATDSRFGSLVSRLDEWSCEESSFSASASHLTALSSCTSEIWYDALDYSCDGISTPAFSLGDIQSALDGILPGYAQSSLSAAGTWIDLNSSPSLPGTMPGAFSVSALSDSPLESLCDWPSVVPISTLCSVDLSQLTTDFPWGSLGDLALVGLPASSSEPFIPGLDDPMEALRREVLLTCGSLPPPSPTSCASLLPENDLPLWVLNNAPSGDLAELDVSSNVPTSVPTPARTLPGAWGESFESVDDL